MTAAQIVSVRPISEIWLALGRARPKHGRVRAFYRNGDNPQAASLNDAKGAWFDHRDQVGGGVRDLIRRVLGCHRADALRWLSEFTGVPLNDRPLTPSARRQYALARKKARDLIAWKERILSALRAERTIWWDVYHATLRYVLDNGIHSEMGDAMAVSHEFSETMIDRLNAQFDSVTRARYTELLPIFRQLKDRSAAAWAQWTSAKCKPQQRRLRRTLKTSTGSSHATLE